MSTRRRPQTTRKLQQTTGADTAEAASDTSSLAKGSTKSKARQLPSLPSAVTAKLAVGEAQLSEIIDEIVDELRPHRRPRKDVQKLVRTVIVELLPTEVTQLKRRLRELPRMH